MTQKKRKKVYISLIVWLLYQIKSADELKKIYEFSQLVWFEQTQKQRQHKASG